MTVTGVNDNIDNDAGGGSLRTVNVSHTVTSSDTDYSGFSVNPVGVTSTDDDTIGSIRLTVNPTSIDEHDDSSGNAIANNTETVTVTAELHGGRSGGQSNTSVRLSEDVVITTSVGAGTTARAEDFIAVTDFEMRIPAGSASGTGSFSLTVVDDGVDDDNEALLVRGTSSPNLTVSPATLTIIDNDEKGVIVSKSSLSVNEDGGIGTYTVRLESVPTGPVVVHLVSNDSSVATVSPSSLTFEVNNDNNRIWSAPQTVTVIGIDDDIDNDVGGGALRKVNVTHSVTSTDIGYSGLSVNPVEVTSTDDDTIGSIRLTANPTSVDEHDDSSSNAIANNTETVTVTAEFEGSSSGGQANANVRLSGPLVITTGVGAVTAQAGDFTAVSDFNINIPAGSASGTGSFNLTLVDDEDDDDDEVLLVRGTTSLGLTVNPATLAIVDNDENGVIISRSSLSVDEDGGIGTYTMRLSKQPTHPVIVVASTSNSAVATASDNIVTFSTGNWNNPRTVTVTGVNDDIDNDAGGSPRTINITHSVTSDDSEYDNVSVRSVEVTSLDDDDIGSVKLTVNQTNINEGTTVRDLNIRVQFEGSTSGGQSNTGVRLSDDLSLSISVVAVTAQADDFDPVSDFNIDIPAGDDRITGSFSLGVVDDGVDENDETLLVTGASSLGLTINPVIITIVDNDERGVIVSRSSLLVSENGGTQTYTVSLKVSPRVP